MVNDGTLHYDHDRDGTHGQMDGCTVSGWWQLGDAALAVSGIIVVSLFHKSKFRNPNDETYATIAYIDRVLTVSVFALLLHHQVTLLHSAVSLFSSPPSSLSLTHTHTHTHTLPFFLSLGDDEHQWRAGVVHLLHGVRCWSSHWLLLWLLSSHWRSCRFVRCDAPLLLLLLLSPLSCLLLSAYRYNAVCQQYEYALVCVCVHV